MGVSIVARRVISRLYSVRSFGVALRPESIAESIAD